MDNITKNRYIKEKADFFFICCNKILDILYDNKEKIKNSTIILDYESIRKKIHEKAPLEDDEISLLVKAMKLISTDCEKQIEERKFLLSGLKKEIEFLT